MDRKIAAVPWWAWMVAAALVWVVGQFLATLPLPAKATLSTTMQIGFIQGLGFVLSWLGSIVLLILAAVTGLPARAGVSPNQVSDAPSPPPPFVVRDQIDTTRWSPELIKSLEWKRVEHLAALYFRALQFNVEEALPGPDGGVDLRLYVPGAKYPGVLVQCKAWSSWQVGAQKIRELLGVMAQEGVNEGIFVTTSTFSFDASEFAATRNIALIDGADLLQKLLNLEPEDQQHILSVITAGDPTTPSCPTCGFRMVTRVSKSSGDPFWGCPRFPRCQSTIPMGRSAAVRSG